MLSFGRFLGQQDPKDAPEQLQANRRIGAKVGAQREDTRKSAVFAGMSQSFRRFLAILADSILDTCGAFREDSASFGHKWR